MAARGTRLGSTHSPHLGKQGGPAGSAAPPLLPPALCRPRSPHHAPVHKCETHTTEEGQPEGHLFDSHLSLGSFVEDQRPDLKLILGVPTIAISGNLVLRKK